jgi:hypothetical protein
VSSGTVVIAGGVFRRVSSGGHVWVFAQYVRGLRRLGYRTVFIDKLTAGEQLDPGRSPALEQAVDLLGGAEAIAVLDAQGESVLGLARDHAERLCRRADALLNVMGYLTEPGLLDGPARRVFVDLDPGFAQMWHALGLADVLAGHDVFVTVGTRIGQPGSSVPTCGLPWVATLPPVVLDDWPAWPGRPDGPVTSVVSWRGPFGPIEYDGRTYGLRVHEFRRFVQLPSRCPDRFELALDIAAADEKDRVALCANGWQLVSPEAVAGDPYRYRRYIATSKAELMIAKNMYVATRGGWFSDRSALYLASGRPVAAQDTRWTEALPSGTGLVAFDDVDGAAAAMADLNDRYRDHCEAARFLAEEHFDSDVVLGRLLENIGVA